ncbi:PEP-CTERM sorting domain-containing protein [Oxalobacteraceae bacterium]|nr:PEP-CTERM sorting domain-containing protein [Oxalobacteraceae bacterium]
MNKKPLVLACSLALTVMSTQQANARDSFWLLQKNWEGFSFSPSWSTLLPPEEGDSVFVLNQESVGVFNLEHEFSTPKFHSLIVDSSRGGVGLAQYNSDPNASNSMMATTEIIGDKGRGSYSQAQGSNWASTLILGKEAGSLGYYSLSRNAALQSDIVYVGYAGSGAFWQDEGSHRSESMRIGDSFGADGNYYFSGGTLDIGTESLGNWGVGNFNQSGGIHTVNSLRVGGFEYGNGNGHYIQTGGNLVVDQEWIGAYGVATFEQRGGSHSVSRLLLGDQSGKTGRYELYSGDLTVNELTIGSGSSFSHWNGTNHVNSLELGREGGGNGNSWGSAIYTLGGIADLKTERTVLGLSGNGEFYQSGGSHTTRMLSLGTGENALGVYRLTGGRLEADIENIGGGGTGRFFQDGGEHIFGSMQLGSMGGEALYEFDGGVLSGDRLFVLSGALVSQRGGTGNVAYELLVDGAYSQYGGKMDAGNLLSIGVNSSNSRGSYYLSEQGELHAKTELIGVGGDGLFVQRGGKNTAETIFLGDEKGVKGEYQLIDGRLSAGSVVVNRASKFEHSGGWSTIEGTLTNDGIYILSGGLLEVNGTVAIGTKNESEFRQMGGKHIATELRLGSSNGVLGYYSLGGGQLITGNELLGDEGRANFLQWGGEHRASSIVLGSDIMRGTFTDGVTGRYSLRGGTLIADKLSLRTSGVVDQFGGAVTINGTLSSSGRYEIGRGSLNVGGSLDIGVERNGSFFQGDATVTARQIVLGSDHGGSGYYSLGGGELRADTELLGTGGWGTFNQFGGTHNVHSMQLGNGGFGEGKYYLSGGALNADYLTIKTGSTFEQSGGASLVWRTLTNEGQLNLSGGTLTLFGNSTLDNRGVLVLGGGELSGRNIVNAGMIYGYGRIAGVIENQGVIRAGSGPTGEYLRLDGWIGNSGTIEANAGATFSARDGIVNFSGTLGIHGGSVTTDGTLDNFGRITGSGTLSATRLNNSGNIDLMDGAVVVHGEVDNRQTGHIGIKGSDVIFNQTVTNNGGIELQGGSVTFAGSYVENGMFYSESGRVHANDMTVTGKGFLIGGEGAEWHIDNSFNNGSTQGSKWDTGRANLFFDGNGTKRLYLAGSDHGVSLSGYADNFAFGSITLDGGLIIADGNAEAGAALYVGLFNLEGGLAKLGGIYSPYNIYYDGTLAGNDYLHGGRYALAGGGFLQSATPVPEPESWALLLAGLGILGGLARHRARRAV